MTIRSRTAQLDDASGELALALSKLELEAAHHASNKDEQIDFVRDLSRGALRQWIRPWRRRAAQAAGLALISLTGAAILPLRLPAAAKAGEPALHGLAILFALLAIASLTIYFRQRRHERQWLRRKEQAILAGGSILDEP